MDKSLDELIKSVQLKVGVIADGKPGPKTWQAIYNSICVDAETDPVLTISPVDSRSESVILTLLPEVHDIARALVHKAESVGIIIKIISGLRTYKEQDALYAKGRTAPGSIVTKAKGGYSFHNFGIAFDIGVFEGNKYLSDSPKYDAVGVLGRDLGLEWGGDWVSIVDRPHYQLRPSWGKSLSNVNMLAALRDRVDKNIPIFS